MDYLHLHVSSYQEFKSLVEQYVNKGGAAVSFDISDNVDAQSYGFMLNDVLTNNSKLSRLDKIKNPREDHRPFPIVRCYIVKEMTMFTRLLAVVGGSLWPKSDKLMDKMSTFRISKMILDHDTTPYWL